MTRVVALALAAAAAASSAADTAALHAAVQGRWRVHVKALAEQVPGWKEMSARQRETVLALLKPMNFEITADRIVLEAAAAGEQDEVVTYAVTGAEGKKLKLTGTDASGEKKPMTLEVVGPDLVRLVPSEGSPLPLTRVRPQPGAP